jgi:hypothetical protein
LPEPAGLRVEQLSTRVAYETPYLRLREDRIRRPDGSEGIYSYLERQAHRWVRTAAPLGTRSGGIAPVTMLFGPSVSCSLLDRDAGPGA